MKLYKSVLPILLLALSFNTFAQVANSTADTPINLNTSLDNLVALGLIPLLPAALLMMSAFTRIIIVLSLTRQALGLQTTPPNQVLVGVALALTAVAMQPTLNQLQEQAFGPWAKNEITLMEATKRSVQPMETFMEKNTRESTKTVFYKPDKTPTIFDKAAAFVLSEMRTGLEIGILILVPFLLIDLIVASILMSLGMMMLSPAMVSLPVKLVVFLLADGWVLIGGSIIGSFQ